jgi:hypothetical protein
MSTQVSNLVIPQLIGDAVRQKLGKLIKFRSIAQVDTSLAGQAGMSFIVPSYGYIGDASVIAEGTAINGDAIAQSSTAPVRIKKIAKDILLTDEAVLASNGQVVSEVEYQLAVSIANAVDADCVTTLLTSTHAPKTLKTAQAQAGFAGLATAFGEAIEGMSILFVNSADYAKVLSMPEFVAVQLGTQFMSGHVGEILGVQIVVSDRLVAGQGLLVKTSAEENGFGTPLGIAYKRDINVETYRDMSTRSTRIGTDALFVTFIRNQASVYKVTIS